MPPEDTVFVILTAQEGSSVSYGRAPHFSPSRLESRRIDNKRSIFTTDNVGAAARTIFMCYWVSVIMTYVLALSTHGASKSNVGAALPFVVSVLAILGYVTTFALSARGYVKKRRDKLLGLEVVDAVASCLEATIVVGLSAASLGYMISGIKTPRYFLLLGCFGSMLAIISKLASLSANYKILQLEGQNMSEEEYRSRVKTAKSLRMLGALSVTLGAMSICMNISAFISTGIDTSGQAWNIAKTIASFGWLTCCVGSFVLLRLANRNRCYHRVLPECEIKPVAEILEEKHKKPIKDARALSVIQRQV
ncbi:hypothetical protein [Anaplasma capra]|uniref:hypothetical protein n=1 Tax=Anaplasma capra TaxID=1562740 RepID=UPI0021D609AF|nr:hypothetical protein [Anaplasma capra]